MKYLMIILLGLSLCKPIKADPTLHYFGGAAATATAYWFYRYPMHMDKTTARLFSLVAGTAINLSAEMLSKDFSSRDAAAGQLGVLTFSLMSFTLDF